MLRNTTQQRSLRGVLLLVIGFMTFWSPSCKPTPAENSSPAEGPSNEMVLKDVIVGKWKTTSLRGDFPTGLSVTFRADGTTESEHPERGGSKDKYKVLDERTIQIDGPPVEKMTVEIVSRDELKLETPDYAVLLKRVK